jgi:hypothetical protein
LKTEIQKIRDAFKARFGHDVKPYTISRLRKKFRADKPQIENPSLKKLPRTSGRLRITSRS